MNKLRFYLVALAAYSMFLSKSFYEFNIFLTSVNLAL